MGYSHYWIADRASDTWRHHAPRWMLDAKHILDAVQSQGITLAGFDHHNEVFHPTCSPLHEAGLAVNGFGLDEHGGELDHESFVIDLVPPTDLGRFPNGFSFEEHMQTVGRRHGGDWAGACKTARKPYDLAVAAILLRGTLLLPGALVIDSDGDWDLEWLNGADAWDGTTGYGARRLVADLFDLPMLVAPGFPSPFAGDLG